MEQTNENFVAERDASLSERDRLQRAITDKGFPFVAFAVSEEAIDENGIWNPVEGESRVEGGVQINVFGDRSHYLKLAEALKRFAEEDTSSDGDHHIHVEPIFTYDKRLRVDLILRKDDAGDASWK